MFNDFCIDGWKAWTSDGNEFSSSSTELLVDEHSPWRELEKKCRDLKIDIIAASVFCGLQYIKMDANNCKLTCGTASHEVRDLSTGASNIRTFRWVRRDEENRWLWAICDFNNTWIVEAPIGIEMCPDPYGIKEQ